MEELGQLLLEWLAALWRAFLDFLAGWFSSPR